VSKNAKELLTRMLDKDPYKRISADDALSHPWFKDNIENI
jgi:serine/threonine protein kinase